MELSELSGALKRTDVLVTCTGAKTVAITAADLADTPVNGVVDLALPADVEPVWLPADGAQARGGGFRVLPVGGLGELE